MRGLLYVLSLCASAGILAQSLDEFLIVTEPEPLQLVEDLEPLPAVEDMDQAAMDAEEKAKRVQVDALLRRGAALLQSNVLYEAGRLYYHAARLDPADEHALAGLGTVFLVSGDAENAVPVFEALVDLAPGEREHVFNLASALLQAGNAEEARSKLKMLTELLLDDPRSWYNLGMAELALNNPDEALEALEQCLALQAEHPFAHLGRARVYLSISQKEDASDALRLARLQMNRKEFLSVIEDPVFDPLREESWIQVLIEKEMEKTLGEEEPEPPTIEQGAEQP